jgi:uncharacterized membrane protein
MKRPLFTRWDLIVFAAFEAMAIAVAVFVSTGWQLPAFVVGAASLGLLAAAFFRFTPAGRRIAASVPHSTDPPPRWLMIVVMVVVLVVAEVLFRALGADNTSGWFGVGIGLWLPTLRILDRWWTTRAGVPA